MNLCSDSQKHISTYRSSGESPRSPCRTIWRRFKHPPRAPLGRGATSLTSSAHSFAPSKWDAHAAMGARALRHRWKRSGGHGSQGSGEGRVLASKLPPKGAAQHPPLERNTGTRYLQGRGTSERGRRLAEADKSLPSKNYGQLIAGLSRRHANLLLQLRTNHVPSQTHLARIGKALTSTRPTCREAPETVAHSLTTSSPAPRIPCIAQFTSVPSATRCSVLRTHPRHGAQQSGLSSTSLQ